MTYSLLLSSGQKKIVTIETHTLHLIPSQDFTKRNGTGGESIYGAPFADEDLSRPVDAPGYVFIRLINSP